MIYLEKYFSQCIKKKVFFLRIKKCNNILSKKQLLKKTKYISLVKYKCKLYNTTNVLCELKIDNAKKIQFCNLFNFKLVDILTIFKILMKLKKIVLYKYNNSISIKVKRRRTEKNCKYNLSWYNNIILFDDFILFLNKYLRRNKKYKLLFRRFIDTELIKKKNKINNVIYNILNGNYINDNKLTTDEKKKKNKIYKYLKRCALKRILRSININIKNKSYANNLNEKNFLIKFYVNNNLFHISSFYKRIKGIYYIYRSVVYIKKNNIKKDIAIINLISDDKSYYEVKKSCIIVNTFYIKYFIKYNLNKIFVLHEEFLKKKFKTLKKNFIHVSPISNYFNNYCGKLQMNYFLIKTIENKNIINTNQFRSIDNNIKIKIFKIYLNGKYFKSFPISLTYNINNKKFYLNNFFYFDIVKYNINNLCIFKDIYLNNLTFFQNNQFYYIDDQNIILNNDNIYIDINYILLFYFLYFNKENLYLPKIINPTFCFYSLLYKKKENSKIIRKIIYKADKNFVNFVF
ncbi:conserved Plasmodium protein, unknown function [Plasmodium relictum]|uniref:Uncharacterized protein n=1 Tax=Plasmodium relictum TaxID=85471 RepID=A0A1J1H7F8_PLARL|nr:conserved Plasmodium protein, unknown function [Plasmodium relictum]CRH00850.1 conserved Plasmodium protein, unknown function [Plasmodium relictum]